MTENELFGNSEQLDDMISRNPQNSRLPPTQMSETRSAVMKWKKDMMLERGLAYSRERYVFRDGTRLTVEYHLEQAQM